MNDNDRREASILAWGFMPLFRALNVGANGRWFMICMVIISIAAQDLFGATVFALCLGAIHLAEGLPLPKQTRLIAVGLIYLVILGRVIVLLLSVQP